MENPTHSFGEMNHVHQLVERLRIKRKILMSWSSQKKECIFSEGILFNIWVLSQCIVY